MDMAEVGPVANSSPGPRGRRHREDQASYPHCSLWRVHDCRELSNNRRATRRLPHQVRLLEHIHTWEGEGW